MALKNEKTYCGNGFPNLPDFKDLSGGGSAAVMAGQAIRISDISASNVSYKRINANVDELTIAVDEVTNKLKSLVKGVKDFSTSEVDTGIKWINGNNIKACVYTFETALSVNNSTWTNTTISKEGKDILLLAIGFTDGGVHPMNAIDYEAGVDVVRLQACRGSATNIKGLILFYVEAATS